GGICSMCQDSPPNKSPVSRTILGIDPGLRITGYAVIESAMKSPRVREAGIIRTAEGAESLAIQVRSLFDGLVDVIRQFQPAAMAVEQLYAHYKHPRTAILMGHARGVIFLAAEQHGVPVASYNATRVKKTITGNGRAHKDQVQRTIQRE